MSAELESNRHCLTQSLLKGFGSFYCLVISINSNRDLEHGLCLGAMG